MLYAFVSRAYIHDISYIIFLDDDLLSAKDGIPFAVLYTNQAVKKLHLRPGARPAKDIAAGADPTSSMPARNFLRLLLLPALMLSWFSGIAAANPGVKTGITYVMKEGTPAFTPS
jgi:hypothetical protein